MLNSRMLNSRNVFFHCQRSQQMGLRLQHLFLRDVTVTEVYQRAKEHHRDLRFLQTRWSKLLRLWVFWRLCE